VILPGRNGCNFDISAQINNRKSIPHFSTTLPSTMFGVPKSKPAVFVVSPALDSVISKQCTSVISPSRHRQHNPYSPNVNIRKTVPHCASTTSSLQLVLQTQLTIHVVAPTLDRLIPRHSTHMCKASRHTDSVSSSPEISRRKMVPHLIQSCTNTRDFHPDPELPLLVPTPALDLPSIHYCTRKRCPR